MLFCALAVSLTTRCQGRYREALFPNTPPAHLLCAPHSRPAVPLDIIYSEEGFKHKEVAVRLDELMKDDQDAAEGLNSAPGGPSTPTPKRLYVYEHKIPRIIHQMWKTTRVMRVFKPFIASWARLHPFWEYRFWTDASGEQFVKTVYPQHWEMFKEFNGIQRSDALRYFILHRYGGVYADLDVEAVAPLDVILDRELILSQEPLAHAVVLENRKRQVCNAFMASARGTPSGHTYTSTWQATKCAETL